MGAFKAYDIRGVYGKDITEESAYRIGYFLPGLLAAKKVLVGRDVRLSSESLFQALCRGITDSGADVYDLGLSTTPFVYFCTARYGFDASVQITASHNPKEYNGFKVSRTGALPVGYETGLADLEKRVMSETPVVPSPDRGKIIPFDKRGDYIEFFRAISPKLI
jgi:phosphomannomutase